MSTFFKTNVTNIGDPFVLKHNDKYYLYATSSPDGFYVWTSDNLTDWIKQPLCYTKSDTSFGYMDFWAPEVVERNGKFIMHYTAKSKELQKLKTGVAVADNPLGPFLDVTPNKPMFDVGYATIDASAFTDTDGSSWLYYTKDVSQNIIDGIRVSQLYAVRLTDDLLSIAGEPVLVSTPEQEWETTISETSRWNEAPYVLKKDGKYYLTYSGNCFNHKMYGIGLAVGDSPTGPFKKYGGNPILKYRENEFSGPGHHCFFEDKNGKLKAAFHIHTNYDVPSGDRRVCFCDVKMDGDVIVFDV